MAPQAEDCISFEHFVKLLHSISQVRPRRADSSRSTNQKPRSLELVDQWFSRVRQYYPFIPPHICKVIFRLLFPEEDIRRRYNLKETALARSLVIDVFGLSIGTHSAGTLMQWAEYPNSMHKAKLGCLGVEVEKVLSDRHSIRQGHSPSIQRIDELLDELASLSGYSNLGTSVPRRKRPRAAILQDLYHDLDPTEAKFLTQIILKDLRPVLYPLAETHTTKALLQYKSNAVHILTKWEVMKSWNPYIPRVYRARATLDEAVSAAEIFQFTNDALRGHEAFAPVLGVPTEIPKSQKGVKLSHALNFFREQSAVWAETKYDGERMQIHLNMSLPVSQQITIFSKSKRNSTLDRMGTHPIIRAALRLSPSPDDYLQYPALQVPTNESSASPIITSVILDAEMVCYSESKGHIDEFWRLRSLIESTAHGVRASRHQSTKQVFNSQESLESDLEESLDAIIESLQSNASDDGDRHLKLVFFDVLFFNGSSLLDQDYTARRRLLERLILQIPGYASLSFRQPISMSGGLPAAVRTLAKIFSGHIADHQEGIVLKAAKSHYNDHRLPWVKLKRDYIPGYGDTVDLVILGAGWNKDRARELRVSPETFTTFFVAALEDSNSPSDLTPCTPRFQILFSVEYGMDREQLETFNLYIKTSEVHPFSETMPSLTYQFVLPQHSFRPAIVFSRPLLAELFGAGFTKHAGAKYYSLRFPRITKVWWSNERNWAEGSHLEEFQDIARLSIGHESGDEWANRTVEAMWGCDVDSGPKDPRKVAESSREWHQKLLDLEMLDSGATRQVSGTPLHHAQNQSSARRKAPPTGMLEPSAKRLKFQADRSPTRPLRALGSMTNVMHKDTDAQRQSRPTATIHPPPVTLVLINKLRGTHNSQEDKIIATQRDTASSVNSELGSGNGSKSLDIPLLVHPSLPTTSLSRSPSCASQLLTSMGLNKKPGAFPSTQFPSPGSPITPATSPQAQSSSQVVSSDEDRAAAKFIDPNWPSKYIHTHMVRFLQTAYVWIPRNSSNKRPASRPPALELVPQNRRIGVMYFLLIICGCRVLETQRTAQQFAHVDKCVIFVTTGDDPKIMDDLNWLFGVLESWRDELNKPGNKELFVFDSNMITYDSLATFHGDVVSQALWRSSRKT